MKKILKAIGVLILSIVAAIGYRAGGSGNYPRYFRELFECTAMMLIMWIFGLWHWSLVLCYGAMWGLLTSYYKKKGTDAKTINWIFVGLAFSISMLPWAILAPYVSPKIDRSHWIGFGMRSIFCVIATPVWCEDVSDPVVEEFGRGLINIVSLTFLLF